MGKGESAEKVVRDIQRKTRRRFSAEERIADMKPLFGSKPTWLRLAGRMRAPPSASWTDTGYFTGFEEIR